MTTVTIGNKKVGQGQPCFIVAEIGINHNGSLDIAKKLIDVAAEAGCDAVKFQKRDVETVYKTEELAAVRKVDESFIRHAIERSKINGRRHQVLPTEALARLMVDITDTTNGDLKYALEFGLHDFNLIEIYCREKGILWFGSSWDGHSAHFLNGFDVPCHKIASACLTHADLLRRIRSNKKPVILSTGGSTLEQVKKAVEVLGTDDLVVLHCIANYPCADEEINLATIDTLRDAFPDVPIGYSGHEQGILPSLMAVSMGACVVERHITLDRAMPGSDQKASLNPLQLQQLVYKIRELEAGNIIIEQLIPIDDMAVIRGDGVKRVLPSEVPVMQKLRRVEDF
ncbi:MAG TPA: N-acetylneuraminate synthase family protein [Candidatus Paceibacterota bacterium]